MDAPRRTNRDEALAETRRKDRVRGITNPDTGLFIPNPGAGCSFNSDGTVDVVNLGALEAYEPNNTYMVAVRLWGPCDSGTSQIELYWNGIEPSDYYDTWQGPYGLTAFSTVTASPFIGVDEPLLANPGGGIALEDVRLESYGILLNTTT